MEHCKTFIKILLKKKIKHLSDTKISKVISIYVITEIRLLNQF